MTKRILLFAWLLAACSGPDETPRRALTPEMKSMQHASNREIELGSPAIPVLLMHEICPAACTPADTYGMSAADFDALLTKLEELGYETISSEDFAAARRGRPVKLPRRPFYLTFDDGRSDAYHGANPVLAAHHARATMFIITADPDTRPFFMSWVEVEQASASGNWDIELHARAGHVTVQASSSTTGHFFAVRDWTPDGGVENHEAWRTRALDDIAAGEVDLSRHLPGRVAHSFAVPFGDYGQSNPDDPEIQADLRAYLDAHYDAWFSQAPDAPFARFSPGGQTFRETVYNTTTVADIAAWLAKHQPS